MIMQTGRRRSQRIRDRPRTAEWARDPRAGRADQGPAARRHAPLDDPNFDRTVIYVLEHHDEGALGVVLNRPSREQLEDEPLDRWVDLQSDPSLVSPAARSRPTP